MSRFDRLVVAAVLALALTIAGLSVALARLGPMVDNMQTATTFDGTEVGTQIAITFTEQMRIASVERSFRLDPKTPGTFNWSGNEMLFTPKDNLAYGRVYTVTIGEGAVDTSGKPLERAFHGTFTTQSQHLLYIGTEGDELHRLVLATITGKRRVVSPGSDQVSNYSVSPDGGLAVYVTRGSPGGRPDELWLLSLGDDSTQQILREPAWNISQPHISPDDRYVAFLATNVRVCHTYEGCYTDTGSPLVYLLDLHSRRVFPFHAAFDAPSTNFIDFSPGGQVAYTDLGSALTLANPDGSHLLHIPNRGNALSFSGFDQSGDKASFVGQTPYSTGGDVLVYWKNGYIDVSRGIYDSSVPSFSSSGNEITFSAYHGEKGIQPLYGIAEYNFKTKRVTRLTSEQDWTDWAPQWSLDDRYIAFVRSAPQEAMYLGSGEIWVMNANGTDARPLGGVGQDITWVS